MSDKSPAFGFKARMSIEENKTEPLCTAYEGTVKFPSAFLSPQYRYKLTTNGEKLQFWLEDCKNKEQWSLFTLNSQHLWAVTDLCSLRSFCRRESAPMGLSEFVEEHSTIPHASFQDYVMCFRDCLETKDINSPTRELIAHHKDNWDLRLYINIHAYQKRWTTNYSIILRRIEVDAIHVLEAKVRDQGDEIRKLQGDVNSLIKHNDSVRTPLAFVRAVAVTQHSSDQYLVWTQGSMACSFVRFSPDGKIVFLASGVFMIQLTIPHGDNKTSIRGRRVARARRSFCHMHTYDLLKNGQVLMSCNDSEGTKSQLQHLLTVSTYDYLTVQHRGNNLASSSISLFLLSLQ